MSCSKFKLTLLFLFFLPLFAGQLHAQSDGAEFFEKKIRPVLADNCYSCHASSMKSPKGGLVLDTKAGTLKGGVSGASIVPGNPQQSLLLRAIRQIDLNLKMPPGDKLSDPVIADFEKWIAMGAPDPRIDNVITVAKVSGIDFAKGKQWWSFQPLLEKAVPSVKQVSWGRTKIDGFILAQLEQNKLKPSAEADARTLILRAYLDLTGLKPSYEEIEKFANDKDPKRYEKLIERLLASAALRRKLGAVLAGRGALWRERRYGRQSSGVSVGLAVSRLGD